MELYVLTYRIHRAFFALPALFLMNISAERKPRWVCVFEHVPKESLDASNIEIAYILSAVYNIGIIHIELDDRPIDTQPCCGGPLLSRTYGNTKIYLPGYFVFFY